MQKPLLKLLAVCLGAACLPADADVVQVNSSTGFKRSTAYSSMLAAHGDGVSGHSDTDCAVE
ncbi:MAG: hypothetical protein V4857_06600 [Pseudomonadota bacterium]